MYFGKDYDVIHSFDILGVVLNSDMHVDTVIGVLGIGTIEGVLKIDEWKHLT